MAKLIDVATLAEDLYYQDYAERDKFFDIDDFKYHCAAAYSTMLDDEFQIVRKENKAEYAVSNVEISSGWLVSQEVPAATYDEEKKEWYAKTDNNIFTFKFDAFGNGLNGVRPCGRKCNLKKISNQEIRFEDIIPVTPDIYYHLQGKNRIVFSKNPNVPLTLFYIPEVIGNDNNCVLSDAMVKPVIMATLQLMFGAKQGNVVHEADDGNKNDVVQQQVNPVLNKVQQL